MLHFLRTPVVALSGSIVFLSVLALQSPLDARWGENSESLFPKLSLTEMAAGCQPVELAGESEGYIPEPELTKAAEGDDLDISRLSPPDADISASTFTAVFNSADLVILYNSDIEPFDYTALADVARTALSEDLVNLYLLPAEKAAERGVIKLYAENYMQECVSLSPASIEAVLNVSKN